MEAGTRAVFHEEADAGAAAQRLRDEGYAASVRRDRFAGEDDDEDQPWAVVSDAPHAVVVRVAEEHDGWAEPVGPVGRSRGADGVPGGPSRPAPAPLPSGPRRAHRVVGGDT